MPTELTATSPDLEFEEAEDHSDPFFKGFRCMLDTDAYRTLPHTAQLVFLTSLSYRNGTHQDERRHRTWESNLTLAAALQLSPKAVGLAFAELERRRMMMVIKVWLHGAFLRGFLDPSVYVVPLRVAQKLAEKRARDAAKAAKEQDQAQRVAARLAKEVAERIPPAAPPATQVKPTPIPVAQALTALLPPAPIVPAPSPAATPPLPSVTLASQAPVNADVRQLIQRCQRAVGLYYTSQGKPSPCHNDSSSIMAAQVLIALEGVEGAARLCGFAVNHWPAVAASVAKTNLLPPFPLTVANLLNGRHIAATREIMAATPAVSSAA
jgi:hypothetical protein